MAEYFWENEAVISSLGYANASKCYYYIITYVNKCKVSNAEA